MRLFHDGKPRLFSCEPRIDESFFGFLLRASDRNRLAGPSILAELFSHDGRKVPEAINLESLSMALGCDLGALVRIFPARYRDDRGCLVYRLGHYWVGKDYFLASRHPRVCPVCLEQLGYTLMIWDMALVTACPRHEILLIDTCSRCGSQLEWNRRNLSHCRCGQYLPRCASQPAHGFQLSLSGLAWSSLGLSPAVSIVPSFRPDVMDRLISLSLGGLFKTIWFLGRYVADRQGCVAGHLRSIVSVDGAAKVVEKSGEYLADWPSKLNEELRVRSRESLPRRKNYDIPAPFRAMHRYMTEDMRSSELKFLVAAYEIEVGKILSEHPSRKGHRRDADRQLILDI